MSFVPIPYIQPSKRLVKLKNKVERAYRIIGGVEMSELREYVRDQYDALVNEYLKVILDE